MIIVVNGQAVPVDLDVVTRFTHDGTAEATAYEVERGVDPVDHVRVDPDRVLIEGVVTDTPIDRPVFGFDGLERLPGPNLLYDGPIERRRAIQEEFTRIRTEREVVTVLTTTRSFESMVLEVAQFVEEAGAGGRMDVRLEFRQIRTATVQVVEVSEPRERRGERKIQRGKQATTQATSQEESENESVLRSLF